jgi:hypothetical protein
MINYVLILIIPSPEGTNHHSPVTNHEDSVSTRMSQKGGSTSIKKEPPTSKGRLQGLFHHEYWCFDVLYYLVAYAAEYHCLNGAQTTASENQRIVGTVIRMLNNCFG